MNAWAQLEQNLQAFDHAGVLKCMKKMLKETPTDERLRNRFFELLWRTNQHLDGLRMALTDKPECLPAERASWLARFLISCDAWPYAAWLMKQVRPTSQRAKTVAGLNFCDLGDHHAALKYLLAIANPKTERRWHVFLAIVIALFHAGRFRQAQDWNKRALSVLTRDPELWFFEAFQGIILGKLGKFTEGLDAIDRADRRNPDARKQTSRLYARTRTWRAIMLAELGRRSEAKIDFSKAETIMQFENPEYQPLRMAMVYHYQQVVGLLDGRRLRDYRAYPLKPPELGAGIVVPALDRAAEFVICLNTNEYSFKGQKIWGVPLEIRLLMWIWLAGDLGLHANLAKCWLWPNELSLFFKLDERLSKLVARLRKEYGLTIQVQGTVMRLGPEEMNRISVDPRSEHRPSLLLGSRDSISIAAIETWYQISASQARNLARQWVTSGWIRPSALGKSTIYRVCV